MTRLTIRSGQSGKFTDLVGAYWKGCSATSRNEINIVVF